MISTKQFWLGALERALKTFLQTFVASAFVFGGAGMITPDALLAAPWLTGLITAGVAAVLSLATSIGNASFTAGQAPEVHYTPMGRNGV